MTSNLCYINIMRKLKGLSYSKYLNLCNYQMHKSPRRGTTISTQTSRHCCQIYEQNSRRNRERENVEWDVAQGMKVQDVQAVERGEAGCETLRLLKVSRTSRTNAPFSLQGFVCTHAALSAAVITPSSRNIPLPQNPTSLVVTIV